MLSLKELNNSVVTTNLNSPPLARKTEAEHDWKINGNKCNKNDWVKAIENSAHLISSEYQKCCVLLGKYEHALKGNLG